MLASPQLTGDLGQPVGPPASMLRKVVATVTGAKLALPRVGLFDHPCLAAGGPAAAEVESHRDHVPSQCQNARTRRCVARAVWPCERR
jgi:hypothetical protein